MMSKIRNRVAAKRVANQMNAMYTWRPGRPPR